MSSPDHHSARHVILPSGRTIEVVYFDDVAARLAHDGAVDGSPAGEMHSCPSCASDTVFPLEWEEAGPAHWEMTLRCPNCEWIGAGIFDQDHVERLEEVLDEGTEALVRDLKRLTRANMEDEVERFSLALAGDHILPMDF